MRTLLTTLAILVILALSAALVGPSLVDWSKNRAVVEDHLSRVLGRPVHVAGAIGIRLLPSPRLDLESVTIGNLRDAAITAKNVHVEMAATALLRGEFVLTEARVSRPAVRLTRNSSGDLVWPWGDPTKGRTVRIDKLVVRDGMLTISDGVTGASVRIDRVAVDAEVSALTGPFRGSGSLRTSAGPVTFRIAAGDLARRRMPMKIAVSRAPGLTRAVFDGLLDLSAGSPALRGAAEFEGIGGAGRAAVPWKLTGTFAASAVRATLGAFEVRLGDDRQSMVATGSAELGYGATSRLTATLAAKTIDIDRQFAGGPPPAVVPPRTALAAVRRLFDDATLAGLPRMPLSLDFTVGLASLGGDALRDVTGSIAFTPGQPLTGKIAASAPGDSHVALDGTFDVGVAPKFQGRLDLASQDWPAALTWAAQGDASVVASIGAFVPFREIGIAGRAEVSGVGFALQDVVARADRSPFSGTLAFTAPVGSERARLSAYLTSDALDVDRLPDLGWLTAGSGDLDLSLDFSANAARVAKVGDTRVDSGRLDLKLDRTANVVVLDRLRVEGVGGASVDAHGRLDPRGGSFEGHLDAGDLGGFAALLQHFVPESVGKAFVARAAALSPAKLDVKVEMTPGDQPAAIVVDGNVGGTKIDGTLDRSATERGGLTARLALDAEDSGRLLRQLGLAGAVAGLGRGRVDVSSTSGDDGTLQSTVTAKIAGTIATWRGRVDPSDGSIEGQATLAGADVAPILRSAGVVDADARGLATDVSADFGLRHGRIEVRRLKGVFAGIGMSGQMALASAPAKLTGSMTADKLALARLTGLVLGPRPGTTINGALSTQPFTGVLATLPETHLGLRVAELDLGYGVVRNAPLELGLKSSDLTMHLEPSRFRGGTLAGDAVLRRSGSNGSLNGRLTLAGIDLKTAFARGKLSAELEFAGTGNSPRALVAALAGQGKLSLVDGELTTLDTGAVDRVVKAVDAETLPLEPAALDRTLLRETARAGVPAAKLDVPILLAAGVARLGPALLPAERAWIEISGMVDLAAARIEVSEAMALETAPADWPGPPPRLTMIWAGPWAVPVRRMESSTFFNGLSARALTINLQKLEEFDADVRERAFFNRRLRVIREHVVEERRAAEARAAEERRRRQERERADEARRLDEMIDARDLPPVGPPVVPPAPPATGPRPGG